MISKMTKAIKRFFFMSALLLLFGYSFIVFVIWFKQRDILFNFQRSPTQFTALGLVNAEQIWLQTSDGERLESFYHPAPIGRPIVLFFHGKGTKLANETLTLKTFAEKNFGYLGVSYRGAGNSSGEASEQGLVTDAISAYDWLRDRGYSSNKIMVLGQSLGSGVAIQLAAQRKVGALALGAPYTSTVDVAELRFWYLPVRYLMSDPFHSLAFIGQVNTPIFVLHGVNDKTIPVAFGKELFMRAHEPKKLKLVEGEGHPLIFKAKSIVDYALFFDGVYVK